MVNRIARVGTLNVMAAPRPSLGHNCGSHLYWMFGGESGSFSPSGAAPGAGSSTTPPYAPAARCTSWLTTSRTIAVASGLREMTGHEAAKWCMRLRSAYSAHGRRIPHGRSGMLSLSSAYAPFTRRSRPRGGGLPCARSSVPAGPREAVEPPCYGMDSSRRRRLSRRSRPPLEERSTRKRDC
jgi:hypothetical protein